MHSTTETTRKRAGGFSLIELLVVVTIILILAAIAIPRYLTAVKFAHATAGAELMRSLDKAEASYIALYPQIGFSQNLAVLGPYSITPSSSAAGLVDSTLADANTTADEGYLFTYTPGIGGSSITTYTLTASPQNQVTYRYYYSDETGELRYSDSGPANGTSALLQ